MYRSLSGGLAVTYFKDVWKTRIPPKIRIFLWQLIQGKLLCSEQVAKWRGPSNGLCSLCGEVEDCNHIFFACHMAQFMWAGIRDILKCDWNPAGAGGFVALAQALSGSFRRLAWFAFTVMFWTLWNVRNKLTMEGMAIAHPADAFFQMYLHMQHWRILVRQKDRTLLDEAVGEVWRLHARTRA
jgi:hypothetical protein